MMEACSGECATPVSMYVPVGWSFYSRDDCKYRNATVLQCTAYAITTVGSSDNMNSYYSCGSLKYPCCDDSLLPCLPLHPLSCLTLFSRLRTPASLIHMASSVVPVPSLGSTLPRLRLLRRYRETTGRGHELPSQCCGLTLPMLRAGLRLPVGSAILIMLSMSTLLSLLRFLSLKGHSLELI